MKDKVILLITGIVVSALALLFWKYAGEYGFLIFYFSLIFGLITDNARLRKKIRELQSSSSE